MTISGTVRGTPPSVNSYVRHSHGRHYRTAKTDDFMQRVAIAFRGKKLSPKARYYVEIHLYLGKGDRIDVDNAPKTVLDALAKCGAIKSDSQVDSMSITKDRDRENPRTEIVVFESRL